MSTPQFKIGDQVTYTILDGEEGRSYGWFYNTKKAKIISVWYKLDNGDMIEEKKLVLESKSEVPKTQQNGSTG